MPTKCAVHNCTKPAVSRGLCDTHRKRVARHGTVDATRPPDWGAREKHPAYTAWGNLRRYHRQNIPAAWLNDFWAFVADIPPKPDGRCSIQRADPTQPWSKDNFYWREPQLSAEKRADRAAYMRAYASLARKNNPDYHKSASLRRQYKISIEHYRQMLDAQGGCCAIYRKPEKMEIKGRVVSLAVDHDHTTGAVRGLLCSNCNTALGLFNDDPKLLDAAKDYLASQTPSACGKPAPS